MLETHNSNVFTDEVLRHFGFLGTLGFRPVDILPGMVRFESDSVFLDVAYDSYVELDLTIGLKGRQGNPERHYGAPEIMELSGQRGFRNFETASEDGIRKLVPRLAGIIKENAVRGLNGDVSFFDELELQRQAKIRQRETEDDLTRMRIEAESAWNSRDWKNVVLAYGAFEPHLTQSEKKKVAYSLRKLGLRSV
jgi:hypothetical protein